MDRMGSHRIGGSICTRNLLANSVAREINRESTLAQRANESLLREQLTAQRSNESLLRQQLVAQQKSVEQQSIEMKHLQELIEM